VSRHRACGYDGPHDAHPVVVVSGDLIALIAAGDYKTPCLTQEWCPGEAAATNGTWCHTHGQPFIRCVGLSDMHEIGTTP
jgi:hypothetical protein